MSTSPTTPSPGSPHVGYESVGYASIEVTCGKEGVSIVANADGFRSLARLFDAMAVHDGEYTHIGLLPTLQLTSVSAPLDLLRRSGGLLPNGQSAPVASEPADGDA